MTPEAQGHLSKAREDLAKAQNVLKQLRYGDEAGRLAYLAAFHAAQALIAERTSRTARTHAGVHSQFHLLTRNDERIEADLRGFLSDSFDLKDDFRLRRRPGCDCIIRRSRSCDRDASRFVDRIAQILA